MWVPFGSSFVYVIIKTFDLTANMLYVIKGMFYNM